MVGGLVPRYDSWAGGRCTLQAQYERRGGGGGGGGLHCLAEEGEVPFMKGQLYDLFNSERFRIDYITTSEILIPEVQKSGGLKPPPPPPPFPY